MVTRRKKVSSPKLRPTTKVPVNSTAKVPVGELRFDRRNPRLIGQGADASDESIIAQLYRSAELDELLQSVSTNGYLDIEPLIVMADSNGAGLIVLEGNRRLATLRLLREEDLARRVGTSERLRITVPQVDESLRASFDRVSVYRVATRKDARSFIGFKHINGAAKWDPYAKARFAADWYRNEQVSLDKIARAIGDRHDTIKRMVSAIYVLEQAKKEEQFDLEDRSTRKFNFSHLYTALSRSQYMKYLGIETAWARYDPEPDPVPQKRLSRLRKVLVWIYGSKEENSEPVVHAQNPDIKRLGEVIVHTEALHVLEETSDLAQAHESTEPADRRFTASLIRARSEIRDASASLRAYDGQDESLLDIAEDVKETAETVHQRMKKKFREANIEE